MMLKKDLSHPGQFFSPDSLTTIHTWAHPAIATDMKAGLTNNSQLALTTLKLRAHTCP